MESAAKDEFCIIILVALTTGLRRCEVLGLCPGYLFDDGNRCGLKVCESRSLHVADTDLKAKMAYRTFKVFQLVQAVHTKSNGYIFSTYSFAYSKQLAARLKDVKLPQVTFHGLRDTYASLLFAKDVDVTYIFKTLGHTTLEITQNYYISLMPEKEREAEGAVIDLLDDV